MTREKQKPAMKKTAPARSQKKLRIGWFSFSCCEDSTIMLMELLNDRFFSWMKYIDICYAKVLRKEGDMKNLDIAFVEGAIAGEHQEEMLKKIRQNSKKLVAIGSCAVTGLPSGQRNDFSDAVKKEISYATKTSTYRKKVVPIHEIVKVDESVPGCPMNEKVFLATLQKLAKEFGVDAQF